MPSPRNSSPAPSLSFSTSALKERSAIDEGEHAKRAAGSLSDLEGGGDDHRAGRRQQVEIAQTLQPIASRAVEQRVRGILRIEQMRLTRIGADGLGAEAVHVALLDQETHGFRRWSRRVRA